jgi:hypothetical protein
MIPPARRRPGRRPRRQSGFSRKRLALLLGVPALGLFLLAGTLILVLSCTRVIFPREAQGSTSHANSDLPASSSTVSATVPPSTPALSTIRPAEPDVKPTVVTPPPVQQEQPVLSDRRAPPPQARVVVKRRVECSEMNMFLQISAAPTVSLDRSSSRHESGTVVQTAKQFLAAGSANPDAALLLIDARSDLAGLPLRRGTACRLTPTAAAHLDTCSGALRGMAREPSALHKLLNDEDPKVNMWLKAESVSVLMQMLMAETAAVREVLAEQLSRIEGKPATEALAQLALFDLAPGVRERAIRALATRPASDYRLLLLRGFEHPWPAVADHAAEAIVALKWKDTVPTLVRLLETPDPQAPYRKVAGGPSFVRELVRVNHLRNCLLCHPPSFDTQDKVRGLVPSPNRPLPVQPVVSWRSEPSPGLFVRADVTYLKQDFATMMPVDNPGAWPNTQRFDFFVRERIASYHDLKKAGRDEHKQSLLFALHELTGQKLDSADNWKKWLLAQALCRLCLSAAPSGEVANFLFCLANSLRGGHLGITWLALSAPHCLPRIR